MKTLLNIEKSEHLIRLGIDVKNAHEFVWNEPCNKFSKCFRLQDLLSILPKEITEGVTTFHLNIDYPLPNQVAARYIDPDDVDNDVYGVMCDELIDALYALLVNIVRSGKYNSKSRNK